MRGFGELCAVRRSLLITKFITYLLEFAVKIFIPLLREINIR